MGGPLELTVTGSSHALGLRLPSTVGLWPGLSLWLSLGSPLRWCGHPESVFLQLLGRKGEA